MMSRTRRGRRFFGSVRADLFVPYEFVMRLPRSGEQLRRFFTTVSSRIVFRTVQGKEELIGKRAIDFGSELCIEIRSDWDGQKVCASQRQRDYVLGTSVPFKEMTVGVRAVDQGSAILRSAERQVSMICYDFHFVRAVLFAENDQITRGLVTSARDQETTSSQEGTNLSDFLRTRILPFALHITQLAKRADVEPDGRQRVEVRSS